MNDYNQNYGYRYRLSTKRITSETERVEQNKIDHQTLFCVDRVNNRTKKLQTPGGKIFYYMNYRYHTVKAAKSVGVHHMSQDVFPVPGTKLTDHAAPTLQTYNNIKLGVRYHFT